MSSASSSSAPSSSAYHSQSQLLDLQLDSSSVGSLSSASLGDASIVTSEPNGHGGGFVGFGGGGALEVEVADLATAVAKAPATLGECDSSVLVPAEATANPIAAAAVAAAAAAAAATQEDEEQELGTVRALEAHQTQIFSAYDEPSVAGALVFVPCDATAAPATSTTAAAAETAVALQLETSATRIERSNSCSQAECGMLAARASAQLVLASSSQSIDCSGSAPTPAAVTGSASHESLAAGPADAENRSYGATAAAAASTSATRSPIACQRAADPDSSLGHLSSASCSPPLRLPQLQLGDQLERSDCSSAWPSASGAVSGGGSGQSSQSAEARASVAQVAQPQVSSSRFFSSKLNTGSLWSLLSVGSGTSMSAINEISANSETDAAEMGRNERGAREHTQDNSASKQLREFTARSANFFNQFKPKSANVQSANLSQNLSQNQAQNQQQQQARQFGAAAMFNSSLSFDQSPRRAPPSTRLAHECELAPDARKCKYRFSVKYIGSAMLHKNFTLPMLEWIVKDVKRATSRVAGAHARQFIIPVREIMLEISSNPSLRLNAISCKDGHAIFVHPMHCVSKYAQLQHDPSSFAYIIRDSKEAPNFCHVFQAKSAQRVHDIFSAIREVTTRSQLAQGAGAAAAAAAAALTKPSAHLACGAPAATAADALTTAAALAGNRALQKSASTDGHWRSLLRGAHASAPAHAEQPGARPIQAAEQQQQEQFENSYQFEVMFVKRVKLQCRRVPPSFVDDALETLKTFEATPKTAQIKAAVTKRIISASVDERQEYDEHCQSPTPDVGAAPTRSGQAQADKKQQQQQQLLQLQLSDEQRRGSSVSLRYQQAGAPSGDSAGAQPASESKSCQQSPLRARAAAAATTATGDLSAQSLSYDFLPYNTITSSDLNERLAAIPLSNSGSVSLDHETRQRLARQVRETILAGGAGGAVAAAGACASPQVTAGPSEDADPTTAGGGGDESMNLNKLPTASAGLQARRAPAASAGPNANRKQQSREGSGQQTSTSTAGVPNNFDLFRRASARQVVKNRTMLLVIGKDELAAISIDKHQMLFSKTFSSIVHCHQGIKNRDHFGLICRDSGKINPQAESYAGFVFKCQSEKVVREIMGALKQVIYSSQHNYHGYYSPYNPLNSLAGQTSSIQTAFNASVGKQRAPAASAEPREPPPPPKSEPRSGAAAGPIDSSHSAEGAARKSSQPPSEPPSAAGGGTQISLAAKRGFVNPLAGLEGARAHSQGGGTGAAATAATDTTLTAAGAATTTAAARGLAHQGAPAPPPSAPALSTSASPMEAAFTAAGLSASALAAAAAAAAVLKNPIKSMFCDDCPLYWYHRLCCDIESLPPDASKAIILRRIDSSLSDREQDEVFTRFSEFKVTSVDEHNEIFMSILRHLTERKQLRHSQTSGHLSALAKSASFARKQSSDLIVPWPRVNGPAAAAATAAHQHHQGEGPHPAALAAAARGHQRSGSSSGSLAFITGGGGGTGAGQRSDQSGQRIDSGALLAIDNLKRAKNSISVSIESILKRRPSLSREEQDQESAVGLADADPRLVRSSSFKGQQSRSSSNSTPTHQNHLSPVQNAANECTNACQNNLRRSQSTSDYPAGGHSTTPATLLSSSFWKKSILDKIHKTTSAVQLPPPPPPQQLSDEASIRHAASSTANPTKRTSEELRGLWKKAIREQITLLKMEKQNQKLLSGKSEQLSRNHEQKQQQQESQEQDEHEHELLGNSVQPVKLNYRDLPHSEDAGQAWARLLGQDPTTRVQFVEVARHVGMGVPKRRRGEVWMFLMNQYQLRHGTSFQPAESEFRGDANQTYRGLLSQLSTQQHEIFVDIGRTFPSHPYYSRYLSIGQLSLFNLLKAYSLLDPQVGYCQGLSFVAGILLLHVDTEDEAFELMRHLMFNFGLRKQYLPSMDALHLQLYQMSRLLRDHELAIFDHFERYDISPSLYAAPWFLTLFASQFPLGFVARLLDLIYLVGIEAVFRVSLTLLGRHRARLLECASLELTMDFLRTDLIRINDSSQASIFVDALSLDLRNKLIEYEIDYSCRSDDKRAPVSGNDCEMKA